jgi:hypothetical protein
MAGLVMSLLGGLFYGKAQMDVNARSALQLQCLQEKDASK